MEREVDDESDIERQIREARLKAEEFSRDLLISRQKEVSSSSIYLNLFKILLKNITMSICKANAMKTLEKGRLGMLNANGLGTPVISSNDDSSRSQDSLEEMAAAAVTAISESRSEITTQSNTISNNFAIESSEKSSNSLTYEESGILLVDKAQDVTITQPAFLLHSELNQSIPESRSPGNDFRGSTTETVTVLQRELTAMKLSSSRKDEVWPQ